MGMEVSHQQGEKLHGCWVDRSLAHTRELVEPSGLDEDPG